MLCRVLIGSIIPFIGTALGACAALADIKKETKGITAVFSGFASGVMVAASVWSLLLPSIDYSTHLKSLSFIPACAGLFLGIIFMIFTEEAFSKYLSFAQDRKDKMLFFAVTLHNIPEGMAIGAAYSAYVFSGNETLALSAFALSMGIAIQNIPEGAIVSLPSETEKGGKGRRFLLGILSGVVEPVAVLMTVLLSEIFVPVLPYTLSFAAGAMFYVVIKELIPDFLKDGKSDVGVIAFTVGFSVMMSLDVALG